ncbi:MAG: SCP2 sterol-binding domain-containing protein [Acidimicrobiia bacterium]
MARYLTQEWFDQFLELSADQPVRPGASARIQYVAEGTPEGDVRYHWVVEDGKLLEAALGDIPDADFTLKMDYAVAQKVQKGQLDPSAAFMQGLMKVTGNMAKMMALLPVTQSPEYRAFQDRVRAVTEYAE